MKLKKSALLWNLYNWQRLEVNFIKLSLVMDQPPIYSQKEF